MMPKVAATFLGKHRATIAKPATVSAEQPNAMRARVAIAVVVKAGPAGQYMTKLSTK